MIALVDEQNTVEMVDLVAEGARRQAAALDLKPRTVTILRADLHVVRALDNTELIWHTQAALGTDLLPGRSRR